MNLNRKVNIPYINVLLTLIFALLLSACSSGLDGSYKGTVFDNRGAWDMQLTFSSDGQVVVSSGGRRQTAGTYEIDDDEVKLTLEDGDSVASKLGNGATWKLQEDGTLRLQTEKAGVSAWLRPRESQ